MEASKANSQYGDPYWKQHGTTWGGIGQENKAPGRQRRGGPSKRRPPAQDGNPLQRGRARDRPQASQSRPRSAKDFTSQAPNRALAVALSQARLLALSQARLLPADRIPGSKLPPQAEKVTGSTEQAHHLHRNGAAKEKSQARPPFRPAGTAPKATGNPSTLADLDTNYTIAHKRAQKVHQKETQTAAAAVKAAEQKVAQARINQEIMEKRLVQQAAHSSFSIPALRSGQAKGSGQDVTLCTVTVEANRPKGNAIPVGRGVGSRLRTVQEEEGGQAYDVAAMRARWLAPRAEGPRNEALTTLASYQSTSEENSGTTVVVHSTSDADVPTETLNPVFLDTATTEVRAPAAVTPGSVEGSRARDNPAFELDPAYEPDPAFQLADDLQEPSTDSSGRGAIHYSLNGDTASSVQDSTSGDLPCAPKSPPPEAYIQSQVPGPLPVRHQRSTTVLAGGNSLGKFSVQDLHISSAESYVAGLSTELPSCLRQLADLHSDSVLGHDEDSGDSQAPTYPPPYELAYQIDAFAADSAEQGSASSERPLSEAANPALLEGVEQAISAARERPLPAARESADIDGAQQVQMAQLETPEEVQMAQQETPGEVQLETPEQAQLEQQEAPEEVQMSQQEASEQAQLAQQEALELAQQETPEQVQLAQQEAPKLVQLAQQEASEQAQLAQQEAPELAQLETPEQVQLETPEQPLFEAHAQLRGQVLCVDIPADDSPPLVGPPPVARSADGDRGAFTSPLSFLDHVMPSNDYSPLAANLATPKTLPSFRAELNLAADTRGDSMLAQGPPKPEPAARKFSLKKALKKCCCGVERSSSAAGGHRRTETLAPLSEFSDDLALAGGSVPTQASAPGRVPGRARGSPFARLGRFFCMA